MARVPNGFCGVPPATDIGNDGSRSRMDDVGVHVGFTRLLNTVYKIASSCIAERLKTVLDHLIHEDQKGFLKGRYIGDNVRLIYDTLQYTEKNNTPGLLLMLDLEKAFDSVSWAFIDRCLTAFNFGNDIKRWVNAFYNNITSCVSINGRYSEWFQVYRGTRQGDPLSPYLFLLCAEIMSLLMRQNVEIKGIKINNKEILLSQFTDDTSIFLDGKKNPFMLVLMH